MLINEIALCVFKFTSIARDVVEQIFVVMQLEEIERTLLKESAAQSNQGLLTWMELAETVGGVLQYPHLGSSNMFSITFS